jgi:hypothetical protein
LDKKDSFTRKESSGFRERLKRDVDGASMEAPGRAGMVDPRLLFAVRTDQLYLSPTIALDFVF